MAHWKKFFDFRFVGAEDIEEHGDVAVTIKEVKLDEVRTEAGKENKLCLLFAGKDKGMVLNKTNAKTIAKLHGGEVEGWVGKRISIFATTCQAFGETVSCIRVRDKVPQ